MFIDERANSFIYNLMSFIMALVLAGALVLVGCDSNGGAAEDEIAELTITPSSATMAVGEHVDFSAAALTASGDTVRDAEIRWWSTDPSVFTVEDGGTATGRKPGTAFCMIAVTNRPFVGRDSAFVSIIGN